MILTQANGNPAAAPPAGRATLDDLFRHAASRRPDATALADAPNRQCFTDGRPRQLTYAEADHMISALAGRLRRIGLHSDAIVGLQMANTVESVLVLLAILRAGLIAMPLPLLWRRADAAAALGRVGANALIVTGRVGAVDHFDLALQVAAEIFSIRFVCAFGRNPPDGIIPLDDLFENATFDPVPSIERERALPPGPGAHLALITWDVSPWGLVPVARSHAELIAGGLAVLLESAIKQDAVMLSTMMMSSFGGITASLLPWLQTGGTLVLHHPFDCSAFMAQRKANRCDTVILPGPMLQQLAEAEHLAASDGLQNLIGVWRAPERLRQAPTWSEIDVALTDVQVFGEVGLLAGHRGANGKPCATHFGLITARDARKDATVVAEIARSPKGTMAMRGGMVPRCAFPAGAEHTAFPFFRVADDGFVDTGYPCRPDKESNVLTLIGAPPAIASVGGYRFALRELEESVNGLDCEATLAVLPDALTGQQLAGSAPDRTYTQEALIRLGVNPLLVEAFSPRFQNSDGADQKTSPDN